MQLISIPIAFLFVPHQVAVAEQAIEAAATIKYDTQLFREFNLLSRDCDCFLLQVQFCCCQKQTQLPQQIISNMWHSAQCNCVGVPTCVCVCVCGKMSNSQITGRDAVRLLASMGAG